MWIGGLRRSVVGLAISLTAPVLAGLPGTIVPENLGVNIHFTHAEKGELDQLTAAGFKFVRMDLFWHDRETRAGQYNWADYDHLLNDLDKHKLRAILILDYNNPLYDGDVAPHTDAGRAAFAKMAAAAVKHFKGRNVLWEMWNEPNGDQFWKPKKNVDDYIKLAMETGKAIKAAAPDELYVGPATSGMDFDFLEACFKSGCLNYWDAVTVHPYRQQDPETVAGDYDRLRKMIAHYAPAGKSIPILSGEWGYSSAWKDMSEARQGKILARQWLINLSQDIHLSIWYDWHDDGTDPKEGEHHFGTVHHDHLPKPAYLAAKKLTHELAGYTFTRRIPLNSPDDYCLEFSRGEKRKFVAWTRSAVAHPQMIPLPAIVNSATKVGGTGSGINITITDTPNYFSPP